MMRNFRQLAAVMLLGACFATTAGAQNQGGRRGYFPSESPTPVASQNSASRTRQELDRVLQTYPPSVKQVLQLDYSLLLSRPYLAPYPRLADFLEQHGEVARDPAFYVGVPKPATSGSSKSATSPVYVYRNLDEVAVAMVVLGVIGGVIWLIRATIGHQRWLRMSRAQADAQAKILERFTSNEELLNFIQTPAGRIFLEASTVPQQAKAVAAPISQILWSVQIGIVLLCAGAGLELLSPPAPDGAVVTFHTLGILVMAIGAGFVFSGFSSYILSRKFGLLNTQASTSQTPPS